MSPQRQTRRLAERSRVGTKLGKVGGVWADAEGGHISVVHAGEQVPALDHPAAEFVTESFAGAAAFRSTMQVPKRPSTRAGPETHRTDDRSSSRDASSSPFND